MGVMQSDCVIGSVYQAQVASFDRFLATVEDDYRPLFAMIPGVCNGEITVVMAPDGSKEFWDTSNACDQVRERFINWLESNDCEWAHVSFGEIGVNLKTHDGVYLTATPQ